MFGFFKSKEDKEVEELVSTLEKMPSNERLNHQGNLVHELASKFQNRYKKTASIVEPIYISGLLTPLSDSGYVIVAIDRNRAIHIHYDDFNTKVELREYEQENLDFLKQWLIDFSKNPISRQGISSQSSIFTTIAQITLLGSEVGIPLDEDEQNYYPFSFNKIKYVILRDDNLVWIALKMDYFEDEDL